MNQKEIEAKILELEAKIDALYNLLIAKANVVNAFLNEIFYPEETKQEKPKKGEKNAK